MPEAIDTEAVAIRKRLIAKAKDAAQRIAALPERADIEFAIEDLLISLTDELAQLEGEIDDREDKIDGLDDRIYDLLREKRGLELKVIGVDCGCAEHPMNTNIRYMHEREFQKAEAKLQAEHGKSWDEMFPQDEYYELTHITMPKSLISGRSALDVSDTVLRRAGG